LLAKGSRKEDLTTVTCGWLDDDTGASAVEYGLIVFAIAAVVVLSVFGLGGAVTEMFSNSCSSIQSAASTTSNC